MFQYPCLLGSQRDSLQILNIFAIMRGQRGMQLPFIAARCTASSCSSSCLPRHDNAHKGSSVHVVGENSHGLLRIISMSTLSILVDTSVGHIYSTKLNTPRVFSLSLRPYPATSPYSPKQYGFIQSFYWE